MHRRLKAVALMSVLLACVGGSSEVRAMCGFPAVVTTTIFPAPAGAPDTGWVNLFAPVPPFPFIGAFTVPLGTPFGDQAMNMAIQAVTTVPVNFMAATGPAGPPGFCGPWCPPPAPAPFGFCAATVVSIFP